MRCRTLLLLHEQLRSRIYDMVTDPTRVSAVPRLPGLGEPDDPRRDPPVSCQLFTT